MIENGKPPTGEEILRLLTRLYADQMGVTVNVTIESGVGEDERNQTAVCGMRQAHH